MIWRPGPCALLGLRSCEGRARGWFAVGDSVRARLCVPCALELLSSRDLERRALVWLLAARNARALRSSPAAVFPRAAAQQGTGPGGAAGRVNGEPTHTGGNVPPTRRGGPDPRSAARPGYAARPESHRGGLLHPGAGNVRALGSEEGSDRSDGEPAGGPA